jgi:hypothetical protein
MFVGNVSETGLKTILIWTGCANTPHRRTRRWWPSAPRWKPTWPTWATKTAPCSSKRSGQDRAGPEPPDPCRLQAAGLADLLHCRRQGSARLDHPHRRHRAAGRRRDPRRLSSAASSARRPSPMTTIVAYKRRARCQGCREDAQRRQRIRRQGRRRDELPVQRLTRQRGDGFGGFLTYTQREKVVFSYNKNSDQPVHWPGMSHSSARVMTR